MSPWNQELWDTHLEDVAFEVVRQKFEANEELRNILLSTGDHILAEATRKDCIWGIGLDVGDVRVQDPNAVARAQRIGFRIDEGPRPFQIDERPRIGTQIGSELMKARDRRGDHSDDMASSPPSRPASSTSIRSRSRSRDRPGLIGYGAT